MQAALSPRVLQISANGQVLKLGVLGEDLVRSVLTVQWGYGASQPRFNGASKLKVDFAAMFSIFGFIDLLLAELWLPRD